MDQVKEVADQRPLAPASDAGGAAQAAAAGASFASDLPVLLVAVLPLIQAIDWIETASAATIGLLSPPAVIEPVSLPAVEPIIADLAIEQALAAVEAPHQSAGSALVYAADIAPLSLNINPSDLFSDAGSLTEVTPRSASAVFVHNVENDIFGRELNVAATPIAPEPSKGKPVGSVVNNPVGEGEPGGTESVMASNGNGWVSSTPYNPEKGTGTPPAGQTPPSSTTGEAETFAVVDMTPMPPPKGDIVP